MARPDFLGDAVADACRLLALARTAQSHRAPDSPAQAEIEAAAPPLSRLLHHPVEPAAATGVHGMKGARQDRIESVNDPELTHVRQSIPRRSDGHKDSVTIELCQ